MQGPVGRPDWMTLGKLGDQKVVADARYVPSRWISAGIRTAGSESACNLLGNKVGDAAYREK